MRCTTRDETLDRLRRHFPEMAERFNVASLAIFGSASRDELRDDSDVDVLVGFREMATFDRFFGLKAYVENLLGRNVDLATHAMLKPRLKANIENELLDVA